MKYLVIDTRDGGDWSLDLLFAGLVKTVGPQDVFDFPMKEKHREWSYSKIGVADWGLERRTLGFTNRNHEVLSDPQLIRRSAAHGDLTVFMDERDESFEVYCRLGLYQLMTPVVIVAGHDRFWNISPEFVQQRLGSRFLHLFIDNWREEFNNLPRTSLINWSANFDHYWHSRCTNVEKTTDICFFDYNSHPDRARFIDFIMSHPKFKTLKLDIVLERRPDVTDVYLSKAEYFARMKRSKVCLNIRGAAEKGKTLRYYEIPFVGSFMLSQTPQDRELHPFKIGQHCGMFSDEQELEDWLIFSLLQGPECEREREEIAAAGHEHLMTYHTCEARTRYVLERIGHGQR